MGRSHGRKFRIVVSSSCCNSAAQGSGCAGATVIGSTAASKRNGEFWMVEVEMAV